MLIVTTGYGYALHAQCTSEENVYTFVFNGHTYEVIMDMKTWSDAAACAVERGGYLVEIGSKAEQDTIYSAIVNGAQVPADYTVVSDGGGIAYIWIGATDQSAEGTWLWDGDGDSTGTNFWNGQGAAGLGDGAPADDLYNNWGGTSSGPPNEPDDFGAGQDGAAIALAKWPAGAPFTLGVASEWNDIGSANTIYFVAEYDCAETRDTIDETACDMYVSPSGKTWDESGTYMDTIANAGGCDSVITINLEIAVETRATIDESACDMYVSPSGKSWDESGTYMDTIANAEGCDSVITVNLEIITIDTSVTQDGNTLMATTSDAMYQWLDCNNGNAIIEGATGQSFVPAATGNYAVVISVGGCSDTSGCHLLDPVVGMKRGSFNDLVTARQGAGHDIYVDLGDIYRDVEVQVFDISGRMVLREAIVQSGEIHLELKEPPGLYFIKIRSGMNQAVIKLAKR